MANVALYQGQRTIAAQPNALIRDVQRNVFLLEPYATPVFQISYQMAKKKAATQPKYEQQVDQLRDMKVALTGGTAYTGNGTPTTTWTDANNVSFVQVGTLLRNLNKQQNFRVTQVDVQSGAMTLQTVDGSNVISGQSGDTMQYLGDPISQGGIFPQSKSTIIQYPYNLTQIMTKPFGVDNTTRASRLYQGNDFEFQKMKALKELKWDIENNFIYGIRNAGQGLDGKTFNLTGGLMDPNIITTYRDSYSEGNLTYALFTSWLRDFVFQKGLRRKVILGNNVFMSDIMNIAQGNIRIEPGVLNRGYGLKFDKWYTPFGEVSFVLMPQVSEPYGVAIALQPEFMFARVLRDIHLASEDSDAGRINQNREDALEDTWICEMGFQYAPEQTASIFLGNA